MITFLFERSSGEFSDIAAEITSSIFIICIHEIDKLLCVYYFSELNDINKYGKTSMLSFQIWCQLLHRGFEKWTIDKYINLIHRLENVNTTHQRKLMLICLYFNHVAGRDYQPKLNSTLRLCFTSLNIIRLN